MYIQYIYTCTDMYVCLCICIHFSVPDPIPSVLKPFEAGLILDPFDFTRSGAWCQPGGLGLQAAAFAHVGGQEQAQRGYHCLRRGGVLCARPCKESV